MKNLLITSLLLLFGALAYAQQGLKYSQTLTFTGTVDQGVSYTVPQNKTWKIESGHVSSLNSIGTASLKINDIEAGKWAGTTNSSILEPNYPIWIKAGDVITIISGNLNMTYFISIIEFDIL